MVDFGDYLNLVRRIGTLAGDENYDASVDLDGGGSIGGEDIAIMRDLLFNAPGPSALH